MSKNHNKSGGFIETCRKSGRSEEFLSSMEMNRLLSPHPHEYLRNCRQIFLFPFLPSKFQENGRSCIAQLS